MFSSKMSVLKPLIESKDGQHLTAYLKNDNNFFHLRKQLIETLETAYEYLAPVMSPNALVRFLAPIHNTIDDTKLIRNLKGNIGIFRNEDSFRILSIPVPVEEAFVVATSFHVKPLLKWMQVDREFFFWGLSKGVASLYHGNQNSFNLVDTFSYSNPDPNVFPFASASGSKTTPLMKVQPDERSVWLNNWLGKIASPTLEIRPPLFVAGTNDDIGSLIKDCRYDNIRRKTVWSSFLQDKTPEICADIRAILKTDVQADLKRALIEFYQAEDYNLASKNIFQIAKAAIKGKVKKLIIADDINIFGKIDSKTGGISIHPIHLDHEDDDILDDIAQSVLAQGGEVIVASRDEIPKGRPILAIFRGPEADLAIENSRKEHRNNQFEEAII